MPKDSLFSTILDHYGYIKKDRLTAAFGISNDRFSYSDDLDVAIGMKQFDRTIDPAKIALVNRDVWIAYKTNPLIWFVTELTVRMVAGNDTQLIATGLESDDPAEKAAAETLQTVALDPLWNSPDNNWPALLSDVCRDMILFGEVIPVPYINTLTGEVTVGFIPSDAIRSMVRDPLNARRVIAIVIKDDKNNDITLPIVALDKAGTTKVMDEDYKSAANATVGRLTGKVFFWAINRTLTSARGCGDFIQAIRPARDAVKVLKSIADRTEINNAVVSELVFETSVSAAEIKNMMTPGHESYINPPRLDVPGPKIFAHNKNLTYNNVPPNIGAAETSETFTMLKAMFCASTSFPEHWVFGQGNNANRATAAEMGEPAFNYITSRQTILKQFVKEIVDFAIDQKRIFTGELNGLTDEQCRAYEIDMPEIDTEDVKARVDIGLAKINGVLAAAMQAGANADQMAAMMRDILVQDFGMKISDEVRSANA